MLKPTDKACFGQVSAMGSITLLDFYKNSPIRKGIIKNGGRAQGAEGRA